MGTYGLVNFSIFFTIAFAVLLLGSFSSQQAFAGNGGDPWIIRDDTEGANTGGDCEGNSSGNGPIPGASWDGENLTCTLTQNLTNFDGIKIVDDDITLDGAGNSIDGEFCESYGVQARFLSGVTVKNLEVFNFHVGILLYNTNDSFVLTNNAHDNCNDGIRLSGTEGGSDGNEVKSNKARDNGFNGIRLTNDSDENTVNRNSASRNGDTFDNDNDDDDVGDGIQLENNSDGNEVKGNTANENVKEGIHLEDSNNNTVSENTANENGSDGIEIEDSDGNTIDDNTTNDNDDDGIDVEDSGSKASPNKFKDNEANNNDDEGFQIDESNWNEFTDNEANGNENGFDISDSDFNTFTGNTANGNGFEDEDCDDGFEIEDGSDGNTFNGNTANNNCLSGFSLEDGSDDNKFNDNIANNNGQDGYEIVDSELNRFNFNTANGNGRNGFGLDNANNGTFFCNTANGNMADGFHLVGSDLNLLDGNTMTSNGKGLLMNGSSDNNTIINNNFISNAGPQIEDDGTGNIINANYFDNFDEFGEGCPDNDVDGFCDVSTSNAIPEPDDVIGGTAGNDDFEAITKPHICDGNEPEPATGACTMLAGVTIFSNTPGIIGTVTPDVDGISIIGHILGEEGIEEFVPITGLAFAPDGTLYATAFITVEGVGGFPFIIEVDPNTGEGIGETARILVIEDGDDLERIIINDLAIDPLTGDIYGFALGSDQLYLIDVTFDRLL